VGQQPGLIQPGLGERRCGSACPALMPGPHLPGGWLAALTGLRLGETRLARLPTPDLGGGWPARGSDHERDDHADGGPADTAEPPRRTC
jgi:hypothetical protein